MVLGPKEAAKVLDLGGSVWKQFMQCVRVRLILMVYA